MFTIVNQAIEKDTDELSKKLLIDALSVAKQELLDYKDAQTMEIKENTSPSSSTPQDTKTTSDTVDERRLILPLLHLMMYLLKMK